MGRYLQVRVSVSTVDEDAVTRAWPTLAKLAWADGLPPEGRKGVLELTAALADRLALGMLPAVAAKALEKAARRVEALRLELEDALAGRKPAEADQKTYALEDALDEAEDLVRKL
ncbi:hypothetical protein [Desulfovibrio aminophilus]|uniref:hypothetical protein n=1 Tax=Desulfovibrio aminophilus TaxID=81425 RepID=UPI0003FB2BF1|nr:hypothetical protein [Desulfovibrio aminophilus]